MNKNILTFFSFLIIVLTNFHCKIKIPEKLAKMNDYTYNLYKTNLQKAISNKDNFEIGIQLCNLDKSKEIVYSFLRKGVLENEKNCIKALKWNQYYLENDFKVNVIILDTLAWKKLCLICQNDKKVLTEFEQNEVNSMRKFDENRKSLDIDSSRFDKQLMILLTIIHDDDQRYRGKEYEKMFKQQNYLDSINLKKVEQIISERSYPSYREVGLELNNTVFLVLHHQGDNAIRKKYLPYLEEAVKNEKLSQGLLDLYNDRTKKSE
jgi:hypothetical protein